MHIMNQVTGFYMRATLAFNGLIDLDFLLRSGQNCKKFNDNNSGKEAFFCPKAFFAQNPSSWTAHHTFLERRQNEITKTLRCFVLLP